MEEALYSSNTDIIECLKKTRVISKFYNDIEIEKWITSESTGYKSGEELPDYRKIPATVYSSQIEINQWIGYRHKFDKYYGTKDYSYDVPISDIVIKDLQKML